MSTDSAGFSAAEALLYLCATRHGRSWLNRALVGVTIAAGLAVGLLRLVTG